MQTTGDLEAEAWALTTDAGRALIADVAKMHSPGPADLARWRRKATANQAAAAVRLTASRRRGASKFSRADRMWLEPTALEQATSEAVARHKARRFADRAGVVFDVCCGIGGDALAIAGAGPRVLAVDRDFGMCRRTLWNASVYDVADRVSAVQARAESIEFPSESWVHVDPDRRTGATRAKDLEGYEPGLDFLHGVTRRCRGGAIKLGPASDFNAHFSAAGFEIELISLGGECKEAAVWFGEAATCRRRATRLPEGITWTDRDGPSGVSAPFRGVGPWVFDPDPALGRSGLLDGFAIVNGLSRLALGVDFLTGERPIGSPFLVAFEVVGTFPLDRKTLRREIAARGIGTLEIKTRGVDVRPEELRKELRPEGEGTATLLVYGAPEGRRAVLARRVGGLEPETCRVRAEGLSP